MTTHKLIGRVHCINVLFIIFSFLDIFQNQGLKRLERICKENSFSSCNDITINLQSLFWHAFVPQ